jgi:nucleoside-diphosphate-sugar epimerase/intein/homing endonuclease
MKVLVSGGAGVLGSSLTELLVEKGFEVTVLDVVRREEAWRLSEVIDRINYVWKSSWDLSREDVEGYDVIFDVGLEFPDRPMGDSSPTHTLIGNLMPPLRLLESVRRAEKKPVCVYGSSYNALYGHPPGTTFTEKTLPLPSNVYGWCARGHTYVITKDGLKHVQDIKVSEDEVLGKDGKWHSVVRKYERNLMPGEYTVTFKPSRGLKIDITPDHLILTPDGWVPTSKIKPYRPGRTDNTTIVEPSPIIDEKPPVGKLMFRYHGYYSEIELNSAFWRFVGFWVAEGSLGKQSSVFAEPGVIRVFQASEEVLEKYLDVARRIDPDTKMYCETKSRKRPLYYLQLWHAGFWKFLQENFTKEGEKTIPLWLANLPKEDFEAFWSGLEEGDGIHSSEPSHAPGITTSSRFLAGRLYVVLRARGERVSISGSKPKKGKTSFRIRRLKGNYQNNGHFGQRRKYGGTKVYDLEVEGDDSYALPGCIVHNSKGAAENLYFAYHKAYGVPVIVTRVGSAFSKRMRSDELAARLIIYGLKGRTFTLRSPQAKRLWTYSGDVLGFYEKLMDKLNECVGLVLHCGGNRGDRIVSNVELATMIKSFIPDLNWVLGDYEPGELINGQPVSFNVDSSFTRKLLGWQPKYSLEEGLREVVEWFKKNIERYV